MPDKPKFERTIKKRPRRATLPTPTPPELSKEDKEFLAKAPLPEKPEVKPTKSAVKKAQAKLDKFVDVKDVFDARAAKELKHMGAVDMYEHDVELLKVEWCMKWPMLSPQQFLMEKKGFSHGQAMKLITIGGESEGWAAAKGLILDRLTESVVKRHIDQLAEVQETHIKASKVGLAKAVEMLSKMQLEPLVDQKSGKIIIDPKTKRPVYRGFRSIDLLNCLGAVEKAQQIYRRAMGLPNEQAGLAQILDKVSLHFNQTNNIQNNLSVTTPEADPVKEKMAKLAADLSYDDIFEFVEFRREQRQKIKELNEGT